MYQMRYRTNPSELAKLGKLHDTSKRVCNDVLAKLEELEATNRKLSDRERMAPIEEAAAECTKAMSKLNEEISAYSRECYFFESEARRCFDALNTTFDSLPERVQEKAAARSSRDLLTGKTCYSLVDTRGYPVGGDIGRRLQEYDVSANISHDMYNSLGYSMSVLERGANMGKDAASAATRLLRALEDRTPPRPARAPKEPACEPEEPSRAPDEPTCEPEEQK